jgi:hypothetical protein
MNAQSSPKHGDEAMNGLWPTRIEGLLQVTAG